MDACFFDVDGVVVDSERHWVPLENDRILPSVVDAPAGEGPTASEITGMNVRDAYAYLDREYGTTVDLDGYLDVYDDAAAALYDDRVALMPGFESLVDDLRRDGVAVALVSSSPHRWLDRVLDRFELRGTLDAVVSAEDVDGPGKPAPGVYEAAASLVDADLPRSVAVEDSTHGLAAARAAGATAIAYRANANADESFPDADAVVDGPDALRDSLDARRKSLDPHRDA
ncbi:HAD family phosphatase [Halorubellus sp. PRR65]|uniref:HAD family hydrolase n=1 Tax=Halorubellus sp. PRR65 TaxID=3098148 RepID=UPI002B262C51|nr:HAD family phosphatase [Halorubellus sp. PRR65]